MTSIVVIGVLAVTAALVTPSSMVSASTIDVNNQDKSVSPDDSIPKGALPRPGDIAASELMAWLDAHPQGGLGGVSVDPTGETVTVSWKGAVPEEFRRFADSQPATVRFAHAAFSAAELTKEAERIATRHPRTVAVVGPREDYSGLVIEFTPSADARAALEAIRIDSFAPITAREATNPVYVSRNADTSPFWGGSLIYSTQQYVCSTGVSVSSGGTSGITIASHCGVGTWRAHDNGVTLGTRWSGKNSAVRDTQVIRTSSAPAAYIGAWNSNVGQQVYRAERPANNTRICTSGGVTGETCSSVYVRGTNMYVNVGGQRVGPGFWVLSEGACGALQCGIIIHGDSGSPTYSYASTGQLIMKGLVVAADPNMMTGACKGHPSYWPAQGFCYSRAFAVNTVDALSTLGVSIKVGGQ